MLLITYADLLSVLLCNNYLYNVMITVKKKHSMTFNVTKSVCMFFKSEVNKKCDNTDMFLSGKTIDFVQETKYLGVILNSQLKTSDDISRQTRKFYAQANMLLRNFRYCSDDVKCMLFRSYCTSSVSRISFRGRFKIFLEKWGYLHGAKRHAARGEATRLSGGFGGMLQREIF